MSQNTNFLTRKKTHSPLWTVLDSFESSVSPVRCVYMLLGSARDFWCIWASALLISGSALVKVVIDMEG